MINAAALINTPRKTNSWVLTIPRWWSSGQHGGRGHRHQGSCHHYGAGWHYGSGQPLMVKNTNVVKNNKVVNKVKVVEVTMVFGVTMVVEVTTPWGSTTPRKSTRPKWSTITIMVDNFKLGGGHHSPLRWMTKSLKRRIKQARYIGIDIYDRS